VRGIAFTGCEKTHALYQAREAAGNPTKVPKRRVRATQDTRFADFQPSLRDYLPSIRLPRIASWAKFSRPFGTFVEFFRGLFSRAEPRAPHIWPGVGEMWEFSDAARECRLRLKISGLIAVNSHIWPKTGQIWGTLVRGKERSAV
jgi:hypothetical protein